MAFMVGKILVLDDEENYAEMLQNLLQQHRFIVDSATKPEKALEALREKGYDLVISDYKMPVMDGADFLQKSREIKPELPVILVSGLMNTPELVKVANMSVTLVLEKPIDIGVFIEHVRRFVSPLSEAEYQKQMGQGAARDGAGGSEFIRTYPADLRYVADSSPSSRQALQALWDSSRIGQPIVIAGPEGTEFELFMRELALWCFPEGAQPVFVAASELTDEKVAEISSAPEGRGAVYGITGLRALSPAQQDMLCRIFTNDPNGGAGNVVAAFLEDGLLSDDTVEWQPQLLECLVRDPVRIAPMQQRVADLAEYAARLAANAARKMERPERAEFDDKCIHFLLQYSWPGNYAEVAAVIKAVVALAESGAITADQVVAAIGDSGGNVPPALAADSGAGLSQALCREQYRIFCKIAADDGVPVEKVVESVAGDSAVSQKDAQKGDVPLLFPHLLKPGNS